MRTVSNNWRRGRIVLVAAMIGALLLAGCEKNEQKKKAPKITLLPPAPPPPPPPPPKFEKKPEPPKQQKEMKEPQQVVQKAQPQAAPELKMDGPAGNGPSAFGAGNITSEDLSKFGSGGKAGVVERTGMFNPFNNYASALKGELQRYLGKNNSLRRRRYSVDIHVWVDGAGQVKRYELIGTSNDSETDEAIRAAMAALPGFSQPPPASMPQPVRLRIVTGG